ncbi:MULTISPECIES: hypothetical protein [Burkholderia cepacia complex]|uniref:hypothetical protein n=1 Tax=Burkholderia cepacia complex TaxID=87882 RepID=UPI001589F542|nr:MULTISPECIES: hypothetical protein [Burkholderia cepacia complex]MBR8426426.1 hypothetical protein [Burkholderia cenocepacia]MBR8494730.1 hypothetical protein [Burkholderia cenocepacia]MCA8081348.1 hypothetical protein [Burkholderia cepacia]
MTRFPSIARRAAALAAPLLMLLPASAAYADDDWGCQVLLCLADPRGPETEAACVPPIEKLWDALWHGDPFPICNFRVRLDLIPEAVRKAIPLDAFNVGKGTGAQHTFAGPGYCRKDLLSWEGNDFPRLVCHASGVIDVKIDGQMYTRVWWGVDNGYGPLGRYGNTRTISEYYGNGSTQKPYDPSKAAEEFQREWEKRQNQNQGYGWSGPRGG